jgi:hypothetical protein
MKPNFSPTYDFEEMGILMNLHATKTAILAYCILLFALEPNNSLLLRSVQRHHR